MPAACPRNSWPSRQTVDANIASVVIIDTAPIGTIDFNLQPIEKDFLLKVGKASALKYLQRRNLDDGPNDATVQTACEEAENSRNAVLRMRKRRNLRRAVVVMLGVIFLGIANHFAPWLWKVCVMTWKSLRHISS